jgi:hypothetical protein
VTFGRGCECEQVECVSRQGGAGDRGGMSRWPAQAAATAARRQMSLRWRAICGECSLKQHTLLHHSHTVVGARSGPEGAPPLPSPQHHVVMHDVTLVLRHRLCITALQKNGPLRVPRVHAWHRFFTMFVVHLMGVDLVAQRLDNPLTSGPWLPARTRFPLLHSAHDCIVTDSDVV